MHIPLIHRNSVARAFSGLALLCSLLCACTAVAAGSTHMPSTSTSQNSQSLQQNSARSGRTSHSSPTTSQQNAMLSPSAPDKVSATELVSEAHSLGRVSAQPVYSSLGVDDDILLRSTSLNESYINADINTPEIGMALVIGAWTASSSLADIHPTIVNAAKLVAPSRTTFDAADIGDSQDSSRSVNAHGESEESASATQTVFEPVDKKQNRNTTAEPSSTSALDMHQRDPKSLKGRFNYAATDCAAVVLKANREARGLTAILNSKKDQYMLNECSAQNKFVIVELCDDILIDTLVMGNYEFFSSTFKDTMVYVSDRYPPKNNTWTLLGHFQARNTRDAQVFPVIDPKIWARYIKVNFVNHYGREFYCPLTVFKVYGATQMEQFRKEEDEEDEDTATLTVGILAGSPENDYQLRFPYRSIHNPHQQTVLRIGDAGSPVKGYLRDMQGIVNEYDARDKDEPKPASMAVPMPKVPNLPWGKEAQSHNRDDDDGDGAEYEDAVEDHDELEGDEDTEEDDEDGEYEEDEDNEQVSRVASDNGTTPSNSKPIGSGASQPQPQRKSQQAPVAQLGGDNAPVVKQVINDGSIKGSSGIADKNTGGGTFSGPIGPGQRGQESIFKTIMRRLTRVERNITLAYHYLEEQHLVFNLVLQQVEMNNLESMQMAIRQLNHSTARQMQSLTALSEEVWRAILYDLEEYQQKTQTEMGAMSQKLEFLAGEVLFEKRMNVAQLVLLLTIIVMIAVNKVVTKLALVPESKKEK